MSKQAKLNVLSAEEERLEAMSAALERGVVPKRITDNKEFRSLVQNIEKEQAILETIREKAKLSTPLSEEEVVSQLSLWKRRKYAKHARRLGQLLAQKNELFDKLVEEFNSFVELNLASVKEEIRIIEAEINRNNPDYFRTLFNGLEGKIALAENKPENFLTLLEQIEQSTDALVAFDDSNFLNEMLLVINNIKNSNQYQIGENVFAVDELKDFILAEKNEKKRLQLQQQLEKLTHKINFRKSLNDILKDLIKAVETKLPAVEVDPPRLSSLPSLEPERPSSVLADSDDSVASPMIPCLLLSSSKVSSEDGASEEDTPKAVGLIEQRKQAFVQRRDSHKIAEAFALQRSASLVDCKYNFAAIRSKWNN